METGYKCPECGQAEEFFADVVEAHFWGCHITKDGWDYFGSDGEVDLCDGTAFRCEHCGYEDIPERFAVR